MTKEAKQLSAQLYAARMEKKMTQKALGKIIGPPHQAIGRVERMELGRGFNTFLRHLKALGYRIEIVEEKG